MSMYTFYICNDAGIAATFEAHELADDAEAFSKASRLIDQYLSSDHIDVRQDDRGIVALHRYQPLLRPVRELRGVFPSP